MNKPCINETIKLARKQKSLTQQELAHEAGLSIRTVQRIEKGTEEISGFSLRQISKVLDIPLEQIIMQNVNQIAIDENQIGSIRKLYLSSLFFILFPLLGFIIPALIGFTKSNKNEEYKKHLRFILLLQAIQSIIIFLTVPIAFFFMMTSTMPQEVQSIELHVFGEQIDNPNSSNHITSHHNNLSYIIFFPIAYYITNIYIVLYKIYHLEDDINS